MVIPKLRPAVHNMQTWFVFIFCLLCSPVFAQYYTVKDSAAFQRALTASRSDAERINYELDLAEYSIEKPGSFKFDMDNATFWINKAKQLNTKLNSKEAEAHILYEESAVLRANGPSAEGTQKLMQAIAILKSCSETCLLADAYSELAGCYDAYDQQQAAPKIAYLKEAVNCYEQCGNKLKAGLTAARLAEMYEKEGNFEMTISMANQVLAIYQSIHFPKTQGLYCTLGDVYYDRSDFYDAVKYYLKSLQTSYAQGEFLLSQTGETSNHLGLALLKLNEITKAVPYFETALIISKNHKDINSIISTAGNLATCYLNLNQPKNALKIFDSSIRPYQKSSMTDRQKLKIDDVYAEIFLGLKRDNNARTYAEEIVTLINTPSADKSDRFLSYNILILYYFSIKDYNKELQFLLANQQAARQIGEPAEEESNLHAWYQMDSAKNDYKNAFMHLVAYKKLEDSILNEKKISEITRLQTEDETQQKEDSIRLKNKNILLLTQNAKLDQARLKGARLTQYVTLAAIVVFILVTGMQYRRYREKQKVNLLITAKNTALQRLVTEKEWLLKEIHHRVKNNLHTVICLLESQAAYLENDALEAVESSQHRIFAMSLIHQRLYQSVDIQTVDMENYLPEFILYLKESFGSPSNIIFRQEIEPVTLDVSQAIPLGLIVNEAVTNAIKYAFPGDRPGMIKIALSCQGNVIRLSVEDNGIGIPDGIETGKSATLGLELIKGLTDDLKGKVQFNIKNGTNVMVSFNKGAISSLL